MLSVFTVSVVSTHSFVRCSPTKESKKKHITLWDVQEVKKQKNVTNTSPIVLLLLMLMLMLMMLMMMIQRVNCPFLNQNIIMILETGTSNDDADGR